MNQGVSIELFTLVQRHLGKRYPKRVVGKALNGVIQKLGQVERLYESLPVAGKRQRKSPAKKASHAPIAKNN